MKFLLFADFHYYPEVFLGCSMPDLQAIQAHAEAEGCDFIIHAGDFCHGPARFPEIVRAYNDFHIPSYHCIGNHDADVSTYEEMMAAYGLENDYYYFDCKGYRMIVLNPNYIREDGQYIHYNLKNNQKADDTDRMNPEQIAWLAETIDSAPGSCILISHQSFERPDGAADREEVQRILRAANDVRFTMLVSLFSMWAFRIAFSYILALYFGLGVLGIWIAMCIDWLCRGIFFVVRFARGKWKSISYI